MLLKSGINVFGERNFTQSAQEWEVTKPYKSMISEQNTSSWNLGSLLPFGKLCLFSHVGEGGSQGGKTWKEKTI